MKILIINNFITPYLIGGAEMVTDNITRNLAKKGHEVILITSGINRKIEIFKPEPNLKIYRFRPKNIYFPYPPEKKRAKIFKLIWWLVNLWNPFVFFTVREIIKKEKPDLINVHNFYSLSASVFSASLLSPVPVVYIAFDYFPVCRNSILLRKNHSVCYNQCKLCRLWTSWNNLFIRRSVKHIFPSEFARKYFRQVKKIKDSKIIHFPFTIKSSEIQQARKIKARIERNKNIIFLFMGRLGVHKGILTLIKSFRNLKGTNQILVILGQGILGAEVQKFADNDSRIKYLGFVSEQQKQKILRVADVLIFPSECFEVTPISIVEAFCYGMPVLGSDIGSIPEHIESGKTGWLFPSGDEYALTEKLQEINHLTKKGIKRYKENCFAKALQIEGENSLSQIVDSFDKWRKNEDK